MSGLLLFIALYLGLLVWFSWTAVRLLTGLEGEGGTDEDMWKVACGLANGFFAVFLGKALIFFKRSSQPLAVEITAEQEPELFGFLHELVVEAQAPRPHRVFLSPEVNAAVFFDLSLVNLIYPTRKNLVIGVGLVNALTLGELKAVLAHEFGHFAQRSMAVGRWVYIAQQIAQQIVSRRDALDDLLSFGSRIDIRIAWIAWLLRVVVWSLRSTLDVAFRLVMFAERALSREMEFQADLVAVSLTGSDALINALHRLGAADEALNEAFEVAAKELAGNRAVNDIYALQTQAVEHLRRILDDPHYGASPELPEHERAQHRVFESPTAQPPKMWATHPPNRAREDNAKQNYVSCPIDPRPAWVLFRDPSETRRAVTRQVLQAMRGNPEPLEHLDHLDQLDHERSREAIQRRFDRRYFDPRYRGAYLGRSCVREHAQVSDLFEKQSVTNVDFSTLYPESLRRELTRWKDALVEKTTLEGLRDGRLRAPEGVIRYRGRAIESHELTSVLEEVHADMQASRQELMAHDRACRSLHWTAAYYLGQDWAAYHYSLVALLHYADHSEADLRDAQRHLANVVAIVTADEQITDAERYRVLRSCEDLHRSLWALHEQAQHVSLPAAVLSGLGVSSWSEAMGQHYSLPAPRENNLGDWLGVIDSWLHGALGPLDALERQSLQVLLDVEAQIEACTIERRHPGPAPAPAVLPQVYRVMPPGSERKLQTQLPLWERFYLAEGLWPAIARTLVAASIVGAVLCSGLYFW